MKKPLDPGLVTDGFWVRVRMGAPVDRGYVETVEISEMIREIR